MTQPAEHPKLTPEEEQEKFKNDAIAQVKANAFHMKRSLDRSNLHEALKFGSQMLGELRTNLLSPQKYYELYLKVFDELQYLESFITDEVKHGTKVEEVYEIVQHAGNIVPRLYLLITTGSVYIKTKGAPAKDILKDLVEMCKGVQHPTRGLFLRTYLSQMSKNKLPDAGNEYEGSGGTVYDSVDFILQNFYEMVRLWIRLETKGNVREREKRDKERNELRMLIGFNLNRLSQLSGVNLSVYEQVRDHPECWNFCVQGFLSCAAFCQAVLKRVLEVIIQCRDPLAQQYLMECLIQVFPDEYHIATLSQYLDACMQLHPSVELEGIFTSLMDRLAKFALSVQDSKSAAADPVVSKGIEGMADLFSKFIGRAVVERSRTMTQAVFVRTQQSLLRLVLRVYTEDVSSNTNVNQCVATLVDHFAVARDRPLDAQTVKSLKKFIVVPMEHYQSVMAVLKLDRIFELLRILPLASRRDVAMDVLQSLFKYGHKIETLETVNKLFSLLSPLVKDDEDQPNESVAISAEDFTEEQTLLSQMVHLFHNADLDQLFKMYSAARKQFGTGGPKRIIHTLIPLAGSFLKLARRIQLAKADNVEVSAQPTKAIQYAMEILQVLKEPIPEAALRAYLETATTADFCQCENQAYEALCQAMELYEEQITESKVQVQVLTTIIATLQNLRNFSDNNYEPLSTKACQYSTKLLKKSDQCQAACMCAHLFWNDARKDSDRVLECLQRSLKIVDGCMAVQQMPLFVWILNQYLYHFSQNNEKITAKYINVLLELIHTNISRSEDAEKSEPASASAQVFFQNTIQYILHKQRGEAGPEADRWKAIVVTPPA